MGETILSICFTVLLGVCCKTDKKRGWHAKLNELGVCNTREERSKGAISPVCDVIYSLSLVTSLRPHGMEGYTSYG